MLTALLIYNVLCVLCTMGMYRIKDYPGLASQKLVLDHVVEVQYFEDFEPLRVVKEYDKKIYIQGVTKTRCVGCIKKPRESSGDSYLVIYLGDDGYYKKEWNVGLIPEIKNAIFYGLVYVSPLNLKETDQIADFAKRREPYGLYDPHVLLIGNRDIPYRPSKFPVEAHREYSGYDQTEISDSERWLAYLYDYLTSPFHLPLNYILKDWT